MLDSFQLINMNGRLYDPVIARMLSPDPFVQAPNSLQNYNRYSYVMNNPLSYTDPSGYQSKFLSFLGKIFNPDQDGSGAGGGKLVIPEFLSGIAEMITAAWNSTNSGEIGAFEGKNYNNKTKSFDKYFQSVGGVRMDASGRPYANFNCIIGFSGITSRIGKESDGTSVYQMFNTTISLKREYLDNLQPILEPNVGLTGSPKTDPSTISNASQVNGIIGFGADMAGFVYRNMDEVVSGAKVLGKVGAGSTVLGAFATAAVIAIEVNNDKANTHTFFDAGVAVTTLGMIGTAAFFTASAIAAGVSAPVWAPVLAISGSAIGLGYGFLTILGSGDYIDKNTDNWGKSVIDSWKK